MAFEYKLMCVGQLEVKKKIKEEITCTANWIENY